MLGFFAAFNRDEEQENLHKMRLEAKKIAAFVYFISEVGNNRKLVKQMKSIKSIFKLAGVIRTSHLNLNLAKEHNLLGENFITEQREIFESGMTEFRLNYFENLETIKSMLRKLAHSFSRISEREIIRYYNEQIRIIASMLNSRENLSYLHECRKKIKYLMYMLSLMPEKLIRKMRIDKDYLDNLQNLIGEWHDIEVAISLYKENEEGSQEDIEILSMQFASKLAEIDRVANHFASRVKGKIRNAD